MKVRGKTLSDYGADVQENYDSWVTATDDFAKQFIENFKEAVAYINGLSDADFDVLTLGNPEKNLLPYLDPGFYGDASGLAYLKETLANNKEYQKETAAHDAEMAAIREEHGDRVGMALSEEEKAAQREAQSAYAGQKAIQDRLGECYIEDFGDDLNVGDGEPHTSAPDWVHEGWQALKDYWGAEDFKSIAQNVRNRLIGQSDRRVAFDSVPYGTMRNVTISQLSHDGVVSTEYIPDAEEAKRTIAWRREQIRLFRAGEIEEINWRPPNTSDPIVAAVQAIKDRGDESDFTRRGHPSVRATSREAERRVSAKERDKAWEKSNE